MNKQKKLAGCLMILAAVTFWISWFLMPDPGTTDTEYILNAVREVRASVLCSVIIQIISSVLYVITLFKLAQLIHPVKKIISTGMIPFCIGAMGLCADAFFHLLAYFMTDSAVSHSAGRGAGYGVYANNRCCIFNTAFASAFYRQPCYSD